MRYDFGSAFRPGKRLSRGAGLILLLMLAAIGSQGQPRGIEELVSRLLASDRAAREEFAAACQHDPEAARGALRLKLSQGVVPPSAFARDLLWDLKMLLGAPEALRYAACVYRHENDDARAREWLLYVVDVLRPSWAWLCELRLATQKESRARSIEECLARRPPQSEGEISTVGSTTAEGLILRSRAYRMLLAGPPKPATDVGAKYKRLSKVAAENAARMAPRMADAWLALAQAECSLCEFDSALAHATRSADLAPGSAAPRALRGDVLWSLGRREEASRERAEAAVLEARQREETARSAEGMAEAYTRATAMFDAVLTLVARGLDTATPYRQALDAYAALLRHHGHESPRAYLECGALRWFMGDWAEAVPDLRAFVQQDSDAAYGYYLLARATPERGDKRAVEEYLGRYRERIIREPEVIIPARYPVLQGDPCGLDYDGVTRIMSASDPGSVARLACVVTSSDADGPTRKRAAVALLARGADELQPVSAELAKIYGRILTDPAFPARVEVVRLLGHVGTKDDLEFLCAVCVHGATLTPDTRAAALHEIICQPRQRSVPLLRHIALSAGRRQDRLEALAGWAKSEGTTVAALSAELLLRGDREDQVLAAEASAGEPMSRLVLYEIAADPGADGATGSKARRVLTELADPLATCMKQPSQRDHR